jgi:hypothetical protein
MIRDVIKVASDDVGPAHAKHQAETVIHPRICFSDKQRGDIVPSFVTYLA